MEKGARTAEKVNISNTALSDAEVKRIFIGGVGAGVTSADMVKTFSPLGRVHAVEFVRTNGRNFAYMDFEPSSVKSMANLFSTYNGCTWKGGKLKLEMAKEHYLARLNREWAEDAKLASASTSAEGNLIIDRSHFPNQENLQIRIFFPKLGKVKTVPLKGSGKHKYSFQRTEDPPFPIHFCDCEEHLKALETTNQKYVSPLSTVMHEKEQNIINNVLNKVLEGDTDNTTSGRKDQAASGPNTLSPSNEDIHCKEREVSDTDDDNLVMNIGAIEGNDIFMQLKSVVTPVTGQESNPQKVQNKADSGKRKESEPTNASSIKPNKRAHSVSADGLSKHEPAPAITQDVTSVVSASETASSIPFISSEGPAHIPKLLAETQDKPNPGTAPLVGSHSWVQKSSWKNLVEGEGSSSFSLSTLLSGAVASSSTKIQAKSTASDTNARPAVRKPEPFSEKSKQIPRNAQITPGNNPKAPPSKDSLYSVQDKSVQEKTVESKTSIVQEQRKERAEFSSGGVCPFMRCAESEQQWAKAKAALSGFIKKKSNENKVSKFTKGMARGKR